MDLSHEYPLATSDTVQLGLRTSYDSLNYSLRIQPS